MKDNRLTILAHIVFLLLVVTACQTQASARPKHADTSAPQPHDAVSAAAALQKTPDGALRAFLASQVGQDLITLREVIMPVSDDDFRYLVDPHPVSPQTRELVVARIASLPIRALQAGDTVPLPGGQTLTVQKRDIGPNDVLLQMQGDPLPVLVHKARGLWYVDASAVIAARKTAAKLNATLPKKATPAHKP